MGLTSRKPGGALRWFLRAPIGLYKAKLGFLLGRRFLMIRHTGRKSGQPRFTVVEVVDHDPDSDTWFVCSGWGRKSDWFQNIQRTPDVVITVGSRSFDARAEELSKEDAERTLRAYATQHPKAFAELGKMMLGKKLEASDEDCHALAAVAPLVALRPR